VNAAAADDVDLTAVRAGKGGVVALPIFVPTEIAGFKSRTGIHHLEMDRLQPRLDNFMFAVKRLERSDRSSE
jgi:hypothetical protein